MMMMMIRIIIIKFVFVLSGVELQNLDTDSTNYRSLMAELEPSLSVM